MIKMIIKKTNAENAMYTWSNLDLGNQISDIQRSLVI